MVATAAAAAAAIGSLANAGVGIASMGRSNAQQQQAYELQQQQLAQAQSNQQYQRMIEAMAAQRSVAGTTDSFGTNVRYDPATNTWVQTLGPLPQAADTAAINANLTRNTTDLMQQELANRVSMQRAGQAGLAYDTAQRNLANFRPMTSDQLTGLLTQQGIEAARQSYDPLRADTLRAVARTGTAAGPVLRQLGLGEAQNLRNTLIDAQLQGLTNVAGINNANYQRLANAATTNQALATPQLAQGNLGQSATDQLLQQLTSQRGTWAPSTTTAGGMSANQGVYGANQQTGAAAGAVPNPNYNLDTAKQGLQDLSSYASGTGANSLTGLVNSISKMFGGGNPSAAANDAGAFTDPAQAMAFFNSSGLNPAAQPFDPSLYNTSTGAYGGSGNTGGSWSDG